MEKQAGKGLQAACVGSWGGGARRHCTNGKETSVAATETGGAVQGNRGQETRFKEQWRAVVAVIHRHQCVFVFFFN